MNRTSGKLKKQGRHALIRKTGSCCGTLNYMAECRGVMKEGKPARRQLHVDGVSSQVRRYPVVHR